jgi:hypothetical protein
MTTRIGGNMLRGSSSFPDLRHHAARFLFSCHIFIPVLILLLILSACSYRQAAGGRTPPSGGWHTVPDSDEDGIADNIDNCPQVANKDQADLNGDGWGDVCDDIDGDLIVDSEDRWPLDPENDYDDDGFGADPYGNCAYICADCNQLKKICDEVDNCPFKANENQEDDDDDGIGNVCDTGIGAEPPDCNPNSPCGSPLDDSKAGKDKDKDGVPDSEDNCLNLKNPYDVDTDGDGTYDAQLNTDNDAFGDPCDDDDDNDGILDDNDNCRVVHNTTQDDLDCDGQGDVCDTDRDGDGYSDAEEISDIGTSPTNADTDSDGWSDGSEIPIDCDSIYNPPITQANDPTPLGDAQYSISFDVRNLSGADIKSNWLPAPSWNTGGQKWDAEKIKIKATLKNPSGAAVAFSGSVTFEILNPTNYEGVATNHTETFVTEPAIDFSFNSTVSGAASDTLQAFNIPGVTGKEIDLYAFDFGGGVTIKVTTVNGGSTVEGEITLPLDSDNDSLPDTWEQQQTGFNPSNAHTFSTTNLDGQVDIDTSLNNSYSGDGLTNFREYRGIVFDTGTTGSITYTHKRLNPHRKDLFVRGDNFQNSLDKPYLTQVPPLSDADVLPFSVDYAAIYNKPGTPGAFEEAGIDAHDVTGRQSFSLAAEPPNIDILVVTNKTAKRADDLIETLLGLENGYINHPSSLMPRYWTWDLKGASYIGTADDYAIFYDPATGVTKRGTETYYLCLMHYFFNRPYLNEDIANAAFATDPGWPGSSCYSAVYLDRLEPLDRVEDFYKENGTNPPDKKGNKKEDRCVVDNNVLDGDRMIPDWKTISGWGAQEYEAGKDYSVFDADGDGRVENPIVIDSAGLDPNQLDPDEYSLQQVQLHTVLHEMGHAVGMSAQHTSDSDCLMYEESINWDRAGHFSPAARSQILIHNKTE